MIKKIALILCLQLVASAQVQSNLMLFNSFIDKSVNLFDTSIPAETKVFLNYHSLFGETIFLNRIQSSLDKSGVVFVFDQSKAEYILNYNLESAKVQYEKVIKDEFLEDFRVERTVSLNGSYQLNNTKGLLSSDKFLFTSKDTVKYSSVKDLEYPSLSFTTAKIPEEPFWPSLMEPAIAIGTIILAIFLFFTVRSN